MRRAAFEIINGELYEIVRRIRADKFIGSEIKNEQVPTLKLWTGCEYIFKNQQTNEYLFVNKVEELEIN